MSRIIKSLKQAVRYARGDEKAGTSALVMELPKPSVERLKQMVMETGADSSAEVVSNALRLYEACLKEIRLGGRLVIRKTDGTEVEVFGRDLWE